MVPMWLWRSLKILIVTVRLLCQRCRCWSSWRHATLTEDGRSSLSCFLCINRIKSVTSETKLCFITLSQGLVSRFSTGLTTTATSVSPLSCSASALMISLRRITFSHFQSNRSDTWHTRSSRLCDVSKGHKHVCVFLNSSVCFNPSLM